ncbi:MAG: oligosaccharide flippase family protein, partial [Burkholderiales bacterium]|nr:oligosaccharide flippase family protein [Burkholderiales bacterium]
AILSRSLALRQIATAEVCATLVAGITAVVMARFQFGHWSLVAQVLLVAGLTTAFYWIASRYRPRLAWS